MRRAIRTLLAVSLLAGCGDVPDVPEEELAIRVSVDARRVSFGAPFEVTVDRVWDASLVPEDWDDATLAPLVVSETGRSRHEAGGRVLERRTFAAHAFEIGDVRVLPPLFVATESDGETERTTSGEGLDLHVTATLDPAAPGAIEFPPGPPEPGRWWVLIVAAAGLFAAGAIWLRSARTGDGRPALDVAPPPPSVGPEVAALARIAELRDRAGERASDAELFDELSAALRAFAVARFPWATEHATTEELLAAAPDSAVSLRPVLTSADLVRFARHAPSDDEIARALDSAERFIRESVS